MKLIIAGGRDFTDYSLLETSVWDFITDHAYPLEKIEILSGSCSIGVHTFTRKDGTKVYGADGLGEKFAEAHGFEVITRPADWKKHGKAAGPIRNSTMANEATHCIVFWDGKSKGSSDMLSKAANITLKVVRTNLSK